MQKRIKVFDKIMIINVWDTAGQERFRSIAGLYYKNAAACLCVFDVTSKESFDELKYWLNQCTTVNDDQKIIMIVGNKIDQPKDQWCINSLEIRDLCEKYHAEYLETDCVSGEGVSRLFQRTAEKIYYLDQEEKEPVIIIDETPKDISHCCYR